MLRLSHAPQSTVVDRELAGEVVHERCLADAGLATDDDELAVPGPLHRLQGSDQGTEGILPLQQHRSNCLPFGV